MGQRRASADERQSQGFEPLQVKNRNSTIVAHNENLVATGSDDAKKRLGKVKDVLKNSKTLK